MSLVVSDTSPIRALAHLARLDVLPALFDEVFIPPAVVNELATPVRKFKPLHLNAMPQLKVQAPGDPARVAAFRKRLDQGESEALALALELSARAVLIDETAGRAVAAAEGLVPIGTIGVLSLAKRQKLLSEIRPLLDRLIQEINFFVGSALYERALRDAGETP